jgi:hypothetical protein
MIQSGLDGSTPCEGWEKREHRPATDPAVYCKGSEIVP